MLKDQPGNPLHYVPQCPRARRWRRGVMLAVGGIVLLLGSKFGPLAWRHGIMLYWQHQCLGYRAGDSVVVYDFPGNKTDQSRPTPWARFYAAWSPPGTRNDTVAFLHERRSPAGRRRLVAVTARPQFLGEMGQILCFEEEVLIPGSPWGAPARPGAPRPSSFTLASSANGALRLFAGQPDPGNPAHFTIAFQRGSESGVIEAWLDNDDTIHFELRPAISVAGR